MSTSKLKILNGPQGRSLANVIVTTSILVNTQVLINLTASRGRLYKTFSSVGLCYAKTWAFLLARVAREANSWRSMCL